MASAHDATGYDVDQIRHAYGFDQIPQDGRGQVIAVVSAFDDVTAATDLNAFDVAMHVRPMFGLPGQAPCGVDTGPHPCFQQLRLSPRLTADADWGAEQAADVEWAHATAAGADILLVEAATPAIAVLMLAASQAVDHGASVVLMSWGAPESPALVALDDLLKRPGVAFIAASGDIGHGVVYPAASSRVIAVGGTTLALNRAGAISSETAWWASGGGVSSLVGEPESQVGISPFTAGRSLPDVSYAASPGFRVFSTPGAGGWTSAEGTSIGAPQWAAIIAITNELHGSNYSTVGVSRLYQLARRPRDYRAAFRDITTGLNGACQSQCSATTGFDLATGLGSPRVQALVKLL